MNPTLSLSQEVKRLQYGNTSFTVRDNLKVDRDWFHAKENGAKGMPICSFLTGGLVLMIFESPPIMFTV